MAHEPHQDYYRGNKQYSAFLEHLDPQSFSKYVDFWVRYTKNRPYARVLDLGCGTGIAMTLFKQRGGHSQTFGVEISKPSIDRCLEQSLHCQEYDGQTLPFPSNFFDLVASHNVIEHVDNVENFLNESIRVLKNGGYLIIACPNFLSITNNYHHHTAGFRQKISNLKDLVNKALSGTSNFNKMATIDRAVFHADDDACNVTNPIDILKWAKNNKLITVYWSSQSAYPKSPFINLVDKTFYRVIFGSSFFVFKK